MNEWEMRRKKKESLPPNAKKLSFSEMGMEGAIKYSNEYVTYVMYVLKFVRSLQIACLLAS